MQEKSMENRCKNDARKSDAKSMKNDAKKHCGRRATPPHPMDPGALDERYC